MSINLNIAAWQAIDTHGENGRFAQMHGNHYGQTLAADLTGKGVNFEVAPLNQLPSEEHPHLITCAGYDGAASIKVALLNLELW